MFFVLLNLQVLETFMFGIEKTFMFGTEKFSSIGNLLPISVKVLNKLGYFLKCRRSQFLKIRDSFQPKTCMSAKLQSVRGLRTWAHRQGTAGRECTVAKVIDFSRYNMKWSRENEILRGIFHVASRFPLLFMLHPEIWITFLTV